MAIVSYVVTMVRGAFVNAWRHRTMTLITALIVSLMMTTVGMFLVLENGLSIMMESMGQRVNLIIYLQEDAPPADVLALRQRLLDDPQITAVDYVTKEMALERLREQLRDQPDLLQTMLGNPLPASLEVRSDDPDYLSAQIDGLLAEPIVEDVDFHRAVVQQLMRITLVARILGIGAGVGLGLVTLFVVGSTIRMTVYARRHEIEVLRLMGASDHFIRWPFLLEGILFGLFGAAVACLLVTGAYVWMHDVLQRLVLIFPVTLDTVHLGRLLLILLIFGTAIGGLGSYLSVRRFLTL